MTYDAKPIDWTQPHKVAMNYEPGKSLSISVDDELWWEAPNERAVPIGDRPMVLSLQYADEEEWPQSVTHEPRWSDE